MHKLFWTPVDHPIVQLSHRIDLSPPGQSEATSTVILGLVKRIHIRNDVLNDKGVLDPALYRPVSRLGDISYATLGDAFRLPRPAWTDVGSALLEAENKSGVNEK